MLIWLFSVKILKIFMQVLNGMKEPEEVKKVINFIQNEMGVNKIRFPETSGIGIKPISKEGSYRLVKAAIEYALDEKRKSLTLVHKGNIMKFTEGAFKSWGYEIAKKEYRNQIVTERESWIIGNKDQILIYQLKKMLN